MSDRVALFIWINDNPMGGNVLKLTNIVEPRCGYEEYHVGQKVLARCPGSGKHAAVIGEIGESSQKKELWALLDDSKRFIQLLTGLGLKTLDNETDKGESGSAIKTTSEDDSSPETKMKSTVVKPKAIKRKVTFAESDQTKLKTFNNETDKGKAGSAPEMISEDDSSPETKMKSTVVKPKAIKRKVTFPESDQTKSKKLQQVADDMAVCDLTQIRVEDEISIGSGTTSTAQSGELFSSSLALLNSPLHSSPRRSPRRQSGQSPRRQCGQACPHREELDQMKMAMANMDFWSKEMWKEIEVMKIDFQSMKNELSSLSAAYSYGQSAFTTPQRRDASSNETCSITTPGGVMSNPTPSPVTPSSISQSLTHRGYTKSQVVADISFTKTFQKATARAFRMLFPKEEIEGRSLGGQKGNKGDTRPPLADREKLAFLEDCVKEAFPGVATSDGIRSVLRHLLKPSRNVK